MGNQNSTSRTQGNTMAGTLCVVMGVIAIASVGFIGLTSFTAFNPPDWARVIGGLLIPFSLVISFILAAFGWRGSNHTMAVVGFILSAIAVIGFVMMLIVGG